MRIIKLVLAIVILVGLLIVAWPIFLILIGILIVAWGSFFVKVKNMRPETFKPEPEQPESLINHDKVVEGDFQEKNAD